MGGWISYVWWGGDPDAPDPVSGLSRREIYAVQSSWAKVYAKPIENGTEFFSRLFRKNPETKQFFRMVRKLQEEEYIKSAQFRAHVFNLMSSLDLAIKNLHQPDVVAAMMNKIGESHKKRHIKREHFHDLKDVIVELLVEMLKLEQTALSAWDKAVSFLYSAIFDTLESQEIAS